MRHNPATGAIVIMLRSLKMHGMAQAVGELTEQGSPAFEAALPILSQILKRRRPIGRFDRRPTNSRRRASPTTATSPALTSPAARSTRRSCDNSIAASSWKTRTMSSWWVAQALGRRISPRRSASRPFSSTASASVSSRPSNSSMLLSRKAAGKAGTDRGAAYPF